jgi:UrcA family protein
METLAKTLTHAVAAIGLAGAAITPAFAAEPAVMTVNVNTADLDLATAKDQKRLEQRVEKAARFVCRTGDVTTGTRLLNHQSRACLAKARISAREQVAALIQEQQRGG